MKILVSDKLSRKGLEVLDEAGDKGLKYDVKTGMSLEELIDAIPPYEGLIIRSSTKVTAEVIDAAANLKIIGRAGIGVDNVDVEAASKQGIIVMNTPDSNAITTAEHAVAMMMALSRNIPQATASMRSGKWEKSRFTGVELMGKTLGVVGLGRIGSLVVKRAQGLEMNIIAFDPYISREAAEKAGVELVELEELLRRSDYISIHVPGMAETMDLIGEKELALVKEGVRIINCARGGIVNEEALYKAITGGRVAGAALDVLAQEPPPGEYPLLRLEQVICTPHLGAATGEAQEKVALAVARQMVDYFTRGQIVNAVNVPNLDPETLAAIRPYLDLAEKLGSFSAQFLEGAAKEVSVEYIGEVAEHDVKLLTVSALKGIMASHKENVNLVNAPILARERGMKVMETTISDAEDFASLIKLELKTEKTKGLVAGTLFADKEPRIVLIDDYRLEAVPSGHMLVFSNMDTPGVIGRIGTIMGNNEVNIAGMQLGRTTPQGMAVAVLNIDSPVPQKVMDEIRALPNIVYAKTIKL
jgi:D-3-phosphoglycerate dehydrogenase